LGNLDGLPAALYNQALVFADQRQLDEALEPHREQEQICRQMGNLDALQRSLSNQAVILQVRGQVSEVIALYKELEHMDRHMGNLDGLQKPQQSSHYPLFLLSNLNLLFFHGQVEKPYFTEKRELKYGPNTKLPSVQQTIQNRCC
jgi:hypothetical protein